VQQWRRKNGLKKWKREARNVASRTASNPEKKSCTELMSTARKDSGVGDAHTGGTESVEVE